MEACRGTFLKSAELSITMPGDFTGVIVDVIGDPTGTRQQSALIIEPDAPWPEGEAIGDRQLLVHVESPLRDTCAEGYRIAKVTRLRDGRVRVDVQDHAPFITGWHQVTELPPDRPNVIRTWRPMVDHGNTPWSNGLKPWFPERDKLYTIKKVNPVGGGFGSDTVEWVQNVNLAGQGIRLGDGYVIYGIRPGPRVTVANDFCRRREPATVWRQYSLRAPGAITVDLPAMQGRLASRVGAGRRRRCTGGKQSFTAEEMQGQVVDILTRYPPELDLDDATAPSLTTLEPDGRDPAKPNGNQRRPAIDLDWVDPPRRPTVGVHDADSGSRRESLSVLLDGQPLTGKAVAIAAGVDGKALTARIDLAGAWADDRARPRKHTAWTAIMPCGV